jgi:hypothetical protein
MAITASEAEASANFHLKAHQKAVEESEKDEEMADLDEEKGKTIFEDDNVKS